MTEIQGKSILVRVSARFELARVRVIGSPLYLPFVCSVLYNVINITRVVIGRCPWSFKVQTLG